MRQFESIFLEATPDPNTVRARVFDLFEELPFAGHPIIGAAAVLHHKSARQNTQTWRVELLSKPVTITTERTAGFTIEGGPDAILTEKPWAMALAERIGFAERMVGNRLILKAFKPVSAALTGRLAA